MKGISIFRKVSLFYSYAKALSNIKNDLKNKFNANIDNIYRVYGVVNIPIDDIGQPYTMRVSDINVLSEGYIKDYIRDISQYFDNYGLKELYQIYEIRKISRSSFLVVLGFSIFNTENFGKFLLFKLIPVIICITSVLIIYFNIGRINWSKIGEFFKVDRLILYGIIILIIYLFFFRKSKS